MANQNRRFLKALLFCALTVFGAKIVVCQTQTSPHQIAPQKLLQNKIEQVDAMMAKRNPDNKPGAAVLVIENGVVVFQKGYGVADIKSRRIITPDTAFDLASMAKQFTALAILQLAEKGKLNLDDSLRKFFPEFPAYADKITVRHLLGHISGLPDYFELFLKSGRLKENNAPGGFEPTNDDVIKMLAGQKEPRFAPGTRWEYSNSGFAVLAKIIEKASGKRFRQYITKNIFKPLKMIESNVYDETKPKLANRAVSYQKKGDVYEDIDYTPFNLIYGDGGINTTIKNLAKWDAALYTERLVKAETLGKPSFPANRTTANRLITDSAGSSKKLHTGWRRRTVVRLRDFGISSFATRIKN